MATALGVSFQRLQQEEALKPVLGRQPPRERVGKKRRTDGCDICGANPGSTNSSRKGTPTFRFASA